MNAREICQSCPHAKSTSRAAVFCAKREERIAINFAIRKCPIGLWDGTPATLASSPSAPFDGSALWQSLHSRALAYATDPDTERAWLAGFAGRVRCGECRRHWLALVEANPPDLTSADAYFAWTVARHNDVSRSIGKPPMTVEVARARWGG